MSSREYVTNKHARSYQRVEETTNSAILDVFVELTGWHRNDARAALREAVKSPIQQVRRKPTCPVGRQPGLFLCRATLRGPAANFLAVSMPCFMPKLRAEKAFDITVGVAASLMKISP